MRDSKRFGGTYRVIDEVADFNEEDWLRISEVLDRERVGIGIVPGSDGAPTPESPPDSDA